MRAKRDPGTHLMLSLHGDNLMEKIKNVSLHPHTMTLCSWLVSWRIVVSGGRLYMITLPGILRAKAGSWGQTFLTAWRSEGKKQWLEPGDREGCVKKATGNLQLWTWPAYYDTTGRSLWNKNPTCLFSLPLISWGSGLIQLNRKLGGQGNPVVESI